jgi:arylsulfatase A
LKLVSFNDAFSRLSQALVLLCAVLSCLPRAAASAERPNILLILADDLGAECLGSYGGTSYRTPHLDQLARAGLRFANCYATPICSPSRVQLMTGRYGFRTGWTNLIDRGSPPFLNPAEFNFAHMLKAAGYRTAVAGKWQLARFEARPHHVRDCGFDEYLCWAWELGGVLTARYWKPVTWADGQAHTNAPSDYGEDLFADFLIDFMARNLTNAFFAYYPMTLPHMPYQRTPDSPSSTATKTQRFREMVRYMDKTVGRLVSALDELGLRESTLILFAGDNGTPIDFVSYANGLRIPGHKGTVTHFGSHVPLIASWKGVINTPGVIHDLVDFSDVLPTLAELCGGAIPDTPQLDGRSFAPRLRGGPGQPRDWVFIQLDKHRFVRGPRLLLHDDGRIYNIRSDPLELNNLQSHLTPAARLEARHLRSVLKQLPSTN